MTTRSMAPVAQQTRNKHLNVLANCAASDGASPLEKLASAKKRRRLSEQFYQSGDISDDELSKAYVSEDAAKNELVASKAPAAAAASAPAWVGPGGRRRFARWLLFAARRRPYRIGFLRSWRCSFLGLGQVGANAVCR